MRTTCWLIAILLGLYGTVRADAPDPERQALAAYKAKDYPAFLKAMRLVEARDPAVPRVVYNVASAEALAGSPDDAVRILARLASTGLSFAIAKDEDFRGLVKRADFQAVVRAMQQNLAPRGKAEPAVTLRERELLAEGVAYDPDTKTMFVSSVRHRKIVAIDDHGKQRDFTPEAQGGVGGVFGIAVDRTRHVLWASSTRLPHMIGYRPADKDVSGVFKYELATGKLLASYLLPADGKPHVLGDVAVAASGDVYTTDSATPTLYRIPAATDKLEVFIDQGFLSLQGMALSADDKMLYVADYARGLYWIDLASKLVRRLDPPAGIATTGIDGLYLHRGRLVATQNGTEPQRVVEFTLSPSGHTLVSQQVLLSGDPRARDLSLGVVVGDVFYLNAAAGWVHYDDLGQAKPGAAAPHVILQLALPR
jgi:SMP-30/Gluconolactonase/LRE-like region